MIIIKNEKSLFACFAITLFVITFVVFSYIVVSLFDNGKTVKIDKNTKIAQNNPIYEVYASRIGLIGNTTFSGLVIKPDSTFVALPSRDVQKKYVKVAYKRRYVICQVLDLGPWSRNDPYWKTRKRPKAE